MYKSRTRKISNQNDAISYKYMILICRFSSTSAKLVLKNIQSERRHIQFTSAYKTDSRMFYDIKP